MLPIISVVGAKNAGKTTVVEALVRELTQRGRRVATIKHCAHGFELDRAGSDSARHAQAGAVSVALRGPDEFALLGKGEEPNFLRLAAFLLEEAEAIIAEGFAQEDLPKIEVVRKAVGENPRHSPEQLMAIVSDVPRAWPVPYFSFEDSAGLADLVESRLVTLRQEATLIIDGKYIPLNLFADSIVAATVRGAVSALRDVPDRPERITLHLRRRG